MIDWQQQTIRVKRYYKTQLGEIKYSIWGEHSFRGFINPAENPLNTIAQCPYIGMNDVCDREIFDGDIIKLVTSEGVCLKKLIKYHSQEGKYIAVDIDNPNHYHGFDQEWISRWAVIGNFFQNKEILYSK